MKLWAAWIAGLVATMLLTMTLNGISEATGLATTTNVGLVNFIIVTAYAIPIIGAPMIAHRKRRRWWLWLILGLFGSYPSFFAVAFAGSPNNRRLCNECLQTSPDWTNVCMHCNAPFQRDALFERVWAVVSGAVVGLGALGGILLYGAVALMFMAAPVAGLWFMSGFFFDHGLSFFGVIARGLFWLIVGGAALGVVGVILAALHAMATAAVAAIRRQSTI